MGISLRAYAKARGCSLTAVQKAIATKRITKLPDGTIDAARANREWARNTLPGQKVPDAVTTPDRFPTHESPAPSGDPTTTYLRARAVKESFAARTAQLEYEERSGKLISTSRVAEYVAGFSSIVKDSLMAMPDRLAPMLAAVDDEKTIHRILAADITAVLRKVSKSVSDAGL